MGDSVAEQTYHALHCYLETATPRVKSANGLSSWRLHGQQPNGLNVSFPAFVHLPAVLLNRSALKEYLVGALKDVDIAIVSLGTWYDWRSGDQTANKSSVANPTMAELVTQASSISGDVTGRILETNCTFSDKALRAAFAASMYEKVDMAGVFAAINPYASNTFATRLPPSPAHTHTHTLRTRNRFGTDHYLAGLAGMLFAAELAVPLF